jgi:hypothetical protein
MDGDHVRYVGGCKRGLCFLLRKELFHVCVCVCVRVCERERDRERKRDRVTERERQREKEEEGEKERERFSSYFSGSGFMRRLCDSHRDFPLHLFELALMSFCHSQ